LDPCINNYRRLEIGGDSAHRKMSRFGTLRIPIPAYLHTCMHAYLDAYRSTMLLCYYALAAAALVLLRVVHEDLTIAGAIVVGVLL
jgi:hypothetical protein